ncbi:hypothetical protein TNCV_4741471 [Trichonephila clavipes]|nr:hypothetical protein TNCV_4741471 [Trichonephila clavipes]
MDTLKSLLIKLSNIRNEYHEIVDNELEPLELEILYFKDDNEDIQAAISRLKSGHIKSLSFCGGWKTFALCTKTQQASPDHILGLSSEDLFSSPLLVLDFLRVNGL